MNYKIKCLREKMKLLEIDGMIIIQSILNTLQEYMQKAH